MAIVEIAGAVGWAVMVATEIVRGYRRRAEVKALRDELAAEKVARAKAEAEVREYRASGARLPGARSSSKPGALARWRTRFKRRPG